MTAIKLRDYQRDAIDAVFKAWANGMQRPAIVLPTGAGKTIVFASLIKEFVGSVKASALHPAAGVSQLRGHRVMVLAHRDELVDQAIAKIRAIAPDLNVGKVKARNREVDADVMVCSVQTLATARALAQLRNAEQHYGDVGLIITDECHHAVAASYKKIYAAFPDALQLGVTATMARGDERGLGDTWEDVVYKRSILWMISKGYLTDVRTKQIDLKALDMGSVGVSRGDYTAGDLGRALMESEADTAIARAYREHAGDRQGIVFTPTVETAEAATRALNEARIRSDMVSGETPRELRQWIYDRYRTGDLQVLVNCMVLTEGFDMPQASAIVIARPTRSATLYAQMVGRGLRPYPGKTDCLVMDLVGASANKLRTLIDLEPDHFRAPVRDGESLAEAAIREEEESNARIPAGSIAFELRARDVDAFSASEHAWVRTPGGVLFINCGDTKVFLWPVDGSEGLWNVCLHVDGKPWQRTEYGSLDLSSAMAWGEAVAEDYASFNTAKTAAWRRQKPSRPQLAKAAAYKIPGAENMRRGELSMALDREIGRRIFDRHVAG